MIELVDDLFRVLFQSDEIENVPASRIEIGLDLDGGPVVVAVEPLAAVPFIADEVAAREDEMVLRHADLESFGHGISHVQRGEGNFIIPSRKAANRDAATRSALVPGL